MVNSMWKIPEVGDVKTPLSLLREQASLLSDLTKGLLFGRVSTFNVETTIYITLEIKVPALDGYSVEILQYTQPAEMFPGYLKDSLNEKTYKVEDVKQFSEIMAASLASSQAQKVLLSLIAQSQ